MPYIAASDHAVFLAAGIPAMQFNHWPDNFYHSSEDRASMADATELKRVAFMGAARKRSADVNKFLADGPRLQGLAAAEAVAFIDGTRSILDIYDAVRAEYGQVTTSSNEYKFAYVVTLQASDRDLEAVANQIRAFEKAGLIEMAKR